MSQYRIQPSRNDSIDMETASNRSKSGSTVSKKSDLVRSLNDRLRFESKSRQETDELYRQLQENYDSLLAKHAQAENTIDQLRIGAKIKLYSDNPKPLEASQVRFINGHGQVPQKLFFPRGNQAVLSGDQLSNSHSTIGSTGSHPLVDSSGDHTRLRTILKLKELQKDIEAFQAALGDRELDYIQQRHLFQTLACQHEELNDELKTLRQAKEDGNNPDGDSFKDRRFSEEFVTPDSLEGELYRLGLKLEEISDEIGEQLHSNDNGNALDQVLKEDFEKLRRSQSFGKASTFSQGERPLTADSIVEEVIATSPRNVNGHPFSESEESSITLDGVGKHEDNYPESESQSSASNYPYAKPTSVWQPGIEDLTESGYYPSESVVNNGSKNESSALGSLYLAPSPTLEKKIPIDVGHAASSSTKSVGESSVGHTLTELGTKTRSEYTDGAKKTREERKLPQRPNTLYVKSFATDASSCKDDEIRSSKSKQSCRSRNSLSDSDRSRSSFDSSTPRATSSPRKDSTLDGKDTRHGRNQRFSHLRPASAGRRSSDKGRGSVTRKEGSARTRSIRLSDDEESSSSDRVSLARNRSRTYSSSPSKHDRRTVSSATNRQSDRGGQQNDSKYLRPNTADSNVDSGFVGSEGSRQSQKFTKSDASIATGGKGTLPSNEVDSSRRCSSEVRVPETGKTGDQVVDHANRMPSAALDSSVRNLNGSGQLTESSPREERYFSVDTSPESRTGRSRQAQRQAHLNSSSPRTQNSTPHARDSTTSTGELYRKQLDKLREKFSRHPTSEIHRKSTGSRNYSYKSPSLSTVDESTYTARQGPSTQAPKSGRHNETQTKMTDRDSVQSDSMRRYSFDLLRDEIQRLRAQLTDEARMRDLHAQLTEDLRCRQSDLERTATWRVAEERHRDMLSDIKQKLDKITSEIHRPESPYNGDTDLHNHKQLYLEVRDKLDGLSREIQRSRERSMPVREPIRATSNRSQELIPICPVCSGTGFHKHGNYVFPRDFLASKSSVRVVSPQDTVPVRVSPDPVRFVTSTPVNRLVKSPLNTSQVYRVVPVEGPTYYSSPNTIHHIHTHHGNYDNSSSSDDSSDSEQIRSKSKRKKRSPRKPKSPGRAWTGLQLEDVRIHESLDEATRAAREMQRVSKKMLSTIASDLIHPVYDEY